MGWGPLDLIFPGANSAYEAFTGDKIAPDMKDLTRPYVKNIFGDKSAGMDLFDFAQTNLNPLDRPMSIIRNWGSEEGGFFQSLDQLLDIQRYGAETGGNSPNQGQVDYLVRKGGSWANKESGGASGKLMNIIGPGIGSYVGGPGGAAAGGAIASKWNDETYEQGAIDATIAAALSYISGGTTMDQAAPVYDSAGNVVASSPYTSAGGAVKTTISSPPGDSLGGGLTGDLAVKAGPEYGYNSYGEGVGPIAESGYPTGTEAQNSFATDEFGQQVDANGNPVEGEVKTNLDPFGEGGNATVDATNPPNKTWSEKAWEQTKQLAKENVGKLGKLGEAISQGGGQTVAGGMTIEGGASMSPEEDAARTKKMARPSAPKAVATNLDLWNEMKKSNTNYDLNMAIRELANYKKKEEIENGYLG